MTLSVGSVAVGSPAGVKVRSAGILGGFRLTQGALGVLYPLSQQSGPLGLQDSDLQQFDRPITVADR